jgi:signal transduction histidine kinase
MIETPPHGGPQPRPSRSVVAAGKGAERKIWTLLPLPPLLVIVVGLATAATVGMLGVSNLAKAGDAHAAERADLIASVLAARLTALPLAEWVDAVQRTARKTGADLVLLDPRGNVTLDASVGMSNTSVLRRALADATGEITTGLGRARFATGRLGLQGTLVVLVREPSVPEGEAAFVRALVALTTLLIVVATGVAYAVALDANRDVEFIGVRVRGMIPVRSEPAGEAVPIRTMDEVGVLTLAFNALVSRFAAAQSSYQTDLGRAHAADRDRAAFLAAVSHELRSPLNAILGFADILVAEVDGPLTPASHEDVEQIRASGRHLFDLINDILDLSALESGQLRLSREKVHLWGTASDVVREAAGLLADKAVTIRVEGDPTVSARADHKRVRQIVTNLVGNAIKFTERGEVVVEIGREGLLATLTVRDTGPGISPQERAVIFEEYKQTEAERGRRRGTGLGLAIARRLAAMQGGAIKLESELGRGSSFKILLPVWVQTRSPT